VSTPPPKAPPRLIEGDSAVGRLLENAAKAPSASTPFQRERIWQRLKGPRRAVVPFLVAAAAAIAVTVAVGWNLRPLPPLAPATLALMSGRVENRHFATKQFELGQAIPPQDDVLIDGRAFFRFPGGGALFFDTSTINLSTELGRVELRMLAGRAIVLSNDITVSTMVEPQYELTAGEALFEVKVATDEVAAFVRVFEGVVTIRSPSTYTKVRAGESWSSREGISPATTEEPRLALVRALARPSGVERTLILEAPERAEIFVDGVPVGPGQVQVLASLGPHSVTAREMVSEQVQAASAGTTPTRIRLRLAAWDEGLAYNKARQLGLDGRGAEAIAMYERFADGDDARAETSLYEIGRIRLRLLRDPGGALKAFDEHARRFPAGALAQEVGLSAIEAQLQLGQLEPALEAMDVFVNRYERSERLNDLRFLQAQVHSEKGDCAVALRLFEGLLADPKYADDALYFSAYCERALGNDTAARQHLHRYLAKFPGGKHRAEAKAALGRR
jgi:tetratricopeptide (TPR) repeat protein